jgi:hypothetical protein
VIDFAKAIRQFFATPLSLMGASLGVTWGQFIFGFLLPVLALVIVI